MKKITLLSLFFIATLCACNFTGPLSITDANDLVEIQKIIEGNFDKETELCYLTLSCGGELSSTLSTINRKYNFKNGYFTDLYFLSDKKFTDPKQTSSIRKEETFKISAIDITIIPEKYSEAIELLNEKGLLKSDKSYYLNNWTFKTNKKGEIISSFKLNYYVSSSAHGRTRTTTYDSHQFELNKNGEVILLK